MYIQKIQIEIKSKADKDEIFEEMNMLTCYYRGNGQSQGRIESQYIAGRKIISLPFTLEKDSLDRKYNNFYTERQIDKIEQLCAAKIQIKTVGKTSADYKSACKCKKSDFYI
jgi:predicted  nucleic acid-binding Zn ribbon protein